MFRWILFLSLCTPLIHADGKTLYAQCSKCHGAKGEATTFSRPIGGWERSQVVNALKAYRAGERSLRGQGSIMRQQMSAFSDAQMEAVAGYIATLKP